MELHGMTDSFWLEPSADLSVHRSKFSLLPKFRFQKCGEYPHYALESIYATGHLCSALQSEARKVSKTGTGVCHI